MKCDFIAAVFEFVLVIMCVSNCCNENKKDMEGRIGDLETVELL